MIEKIEVNGKGYKVEEPFRKYVVKRNKEKAREQMHFMEKNYSDCIKDSVNRTKIYAGGWVCLDWTRHHSSSQTPKYFLLDMDTIQALFFIKENLPTVYSMKMLNGTWLAYLERIDTTAKEMIDKLIKDMAVKQGITEELKAKDQMAWVGAMNNIRHSAEEIVCKDLLFR